MASFTLHHGDALEVLRGMPDNCVDAVVTDPPYFKVKNLAWDRQWDKPRAFLAWMGELCEQWQRVLKPNGSLYCFASPKMARQVGNRIAERFNILSEITWAKPERHYVPPYCGNDMQRTFTPLSERIIFAEHFGADNIAKGEAGYAAKCDELRGFVFEPLRAYLDGERIAAGLTPDEVNVICGFREKGGMAGRHWFNASQFAMPTEKSYLAARAATGRFQREYEDLRREYEDLRRPFSVTADVPYTDVWDFPTVQAYKGKHPCEKPLAMLLHIVRSSTREGATVLDCFMGSGSTGEAALRLGRNFIGIEKDAEWIAKARTRLEGASTVAPVADIAPARRRHQSRIASAPLLPLFADAEEVA